MEQTYVFKSNFLFSSGTWPVTGCRNVFRLSLWLWRQNGERSCGQHEESTGTRKGGQALGSDRAGDNVGARSSLLCPQWDRERLRDTAAVRWGWKTHLSLACVNHSLRSLRLEISPI